MNKVYPSGDVEEMMVGDIKYVRADKIKSEGLSLDYDKLGTVIGDIVSDAVESKLEQMREIMPASDKVVDISRQGRRWLNGPVKVTNIRPKTTSGIPEDKDELRSHIRSLIIDLMVMSNLNSPMAWNKAYRLLYEFGKFDVYKYHNAGNRANKSMLDTVFEHGKADK